MARPWKYDRLIKALKDNELYNTAKVISHCESMGLFDWAFDDPDIRLNEIQKKDLMANARSSLAHFVGKYLPNDPDGYVKASKPARAMYPGWFGWRWKERQKDSIRSR